MSRSLTSYSEALHPYRWRLLSVALLGLLLCVALMFLRPGNLGFALAGPFVILPWTLMLVSGWSKQRLPLVRGFYAFLLPVMLVLALLWPAIVLLT
jgi:hypothetical protein